MSKGSQKKSNHLCLIIFISIAMAVLLYFTFPISKEGNKLTSNDSEMVKSIKLFKL